MIDFPGISFSPSADRNKEPIAKIVLPYLDKGAHVLEIASGTGQHAHYMTTARPDLKWQLSDQDDQALLNLQTLSETAPQKLLPPISIDVTVKAWWTNLGVYDAIYCANMIHIAPKAALPGLANGVAPLLKPYGSFFLYGPFLDEDNSADSNLAFDQSLMARNPEWGVKDLHHVKHIFAQNGLACAHEMEMPRDNSLLIFRHSDFIGEFPG